jgi:membrane protein
MQVFPGLSLGIILCAAIFAIQNSTAPPAAMKFLLWNFETSLIYTVLGSIGMGMLITLFLWIPRAIRASFRTRNLKKEIEVLRGEMKNRNEESKKKDLKKDVAQDFSSKPRLFWEALKKFDADHGFFLASGITFNLLICLIPLILLLLALVGTYLYSDQEVFNHVRRYFESAVPSLDPRIMENLTTIIQDRKIVSALGLGGLIWASTLIFSSLRTALNIVFQVEKGRSLLRGTAVDFLMVFLAGFLLLLSMVLTSGIAIIQTFQLFPFLNIGPVMQLILRYLLPLAFTFLMSFLIYKISPNRKVLSLPALQAALFTSLLWEIAKHMFGWYVQLSPRFSMLYGSLSTLAIFFFWIYYSAMILLLGGEIAFLSEKGAKKINHR